MAMIRGLAIKKVCTFDKYFELQCAIKEYADGIDINYVPDPRDDDYLHVSDMSAAFSILIDTLLTIIMK